ncbi:MAG TPA: hypothetical protein VKP04_04575 [Ktedonobacteraceae bacterium]|nr:hypothetical protein [Ktedonobacteraceae bacterium]
MKTADKPIRAPLSEYAKASEPRPITQTSTIILLIILITAGGLPLVLWGLSSGDSFNLWVVLIASIIGIIFILWVVVAAVVDRFKVSAALEPWLDQNDLDFATSKTIQQRIDALLSSPLSTLNPFDSKICIYQNLRLGEMNRLIDKQMKSVIIQWLDYQFGIKGEESRKLRDILLSDGFVAILEQDLQDNQVDTIRVVMPSELAVREFIKQFMDQLSTTLHEKSHSGSVISMNVESVQQFVSISYIFDRLNALLRMPPERRCRVNLIGTKVTKYAILADMLLFENESQSYTLFPVHLLKKISEITHEARDGLALAGPAI